MYELRKYYFIKWYFLLEFRFTALKFSFQRRNIIKIFSETAVNSESDMVFKFDFE